MRPGRKQASVFVMAKKGESVSGEDRGLQAVPLRVWRSVFPRPIVPRTEKERRKTILDFFRDLTAKERK